VKTNVTKLVEEGPCYHTILSLSANPSKGTKTSGTIEVLPLSPRTTISLILANDKSNIREDSIVEPWVPKER
jgi:hypothetical protein